jgi:hypothetical protein
MSALCQKQTFCAAVENVVIRSPAEQRNELAPPHSITSSAIESTPDGTSIRD